MQLGCFIHFSVVPAGQTELRQAWHELSFGIEHVHGFQELHPTVVPPLPAGFELHSITPAKQDSLVQLSDLIWRQQTQAPIWGIHLPEANDAADCAEAAADPELTDWLVTKDQEPVAAIGYFPAADFDEALVIPENSVHLTLAGVKPAYRGSGIGHTLTTLALQDALKNGYAH